MKMPKHIPFIGLMTPARSILLIVLLVIAIFVLFIPIRNGIRIRRELAAAKTQLADLKVLFPLYAEMMAMEKPANWPDLKAPARERLQDADVVTIPDRILKRASKAGIEISAVSPKVQVDEDGARWLMVDIRAMGPYENLRGFLINLAQIPYLDRVERIELRRELMREQINVVIRLALE